MTVDQLFVADYRAGRTYAVDGGGARVLGRGVLAEHAGVLALPRGGATDAQWAFVDDRSGALVALGPGGERRVPVAIPGEHLACDPSGRYVVVTTGLGANASAWSDVVTVVDLPAGESVRFRSRTGEPGALVVPDQAGGEPVAVLRHREPGAVEALPLTRCLDAGAHVPALAGAVLDGIADDGHGDVVDQRTGVAATATSRGLERFVVDDGVPRTIGVVPWPVPGRAFYLRFDPATGRAVGVVRGGPAAPAAWTRWTNHLVDIDLSTGDTHCLELPPGLAFRFALGGGRAAVATIHPEQDELTLVERAGPELRVLYRRPLPAMSRPPAAGRLPWDPVGDAPAQRRAVALDPSGTTAAVTRGGDAELHLVREDRLDTVGMPSPLDEGGHLHWSGGGFDPVGR
ncbi:hypothetical protein ACFPZ0_00195 [Streptomonospora nanhaiensis]|uniref:hypothetical protein n=1 Tax=Streptomonospora nanhaiensis TaxID=1323731 RepID=UPI001C9910EC|nr:hypothetical protein [Streptomonospora nanhaiensis]MBX9386709.1 hypothetical protein [Streptomonospora nanhaiensis]